MDKYQGVIYILTNPSFKEYVKIGYADDVEKRLKELNRSECIPFAFRLYAYYEVSQRLTDKKLHDLIDMINPDLRAIEEFDGKKRTREFYSMTPEKAYLILKAISQINGLEHNLHKVDPSDEELNDEETAEENRYLASNRHHFKDIEFSCSLNGHSYHSATRNDGTLKIIDLTIGEEVPNNSKPSKKEILRQAIEDITHKKEEGTTYQLMHRLEKIVLKS